MSLYGALVIFLPLSLTIGKFALIILKVTITKLVLPNRITFVKPNYADRGEANAD